MKILRYALFLVFAMTGSLLAAEEAATPPTEYERAVKAYVDAAGDQLRATRSQLFAMASIPPVEQSKKRVEKVYASLGECDKLLVELKKAGPQDFDTVKGKFEQARAVMLKALETARKG